jgi:hypothetical protein
MKSACITDLALGLYLRLWPKQMFSRCRGKWGYFSENVFLKPCGLYSLCLPIPYDVYETVSSEVVIGADILSKL